jgi:hypothetical protein
MPMTVDIANKRMLYVRYNHENRLSFLTILKDWNYTIREHLWDESEYTFPIFTIDPVNKLVFGANTTVMACYCTQGGREISQETALSILQSHGTTHE